MCRYCFDSLSDGRRYERCEGARKTVLTWECEISYNQNRVRVVGSQLFRAAANIETGFSYLIYILAIIYQRGCMSVLVGVPLISMSPSECLFGRCQLDLKFRLKMLLRRRFWVEAQIHYPLCFGQARCWYIFP